MRSLVRGRLWADIAAIALVLICGLGGNASAQGSSPDYPLRISAGGTHLVDQRDRAFLINGDTAWSLIAALSREDAEIYLENRRQKGFNLVLANLLEHGFAANPPANHYGHQPFTIAGNFTTPNDAYFAHADWVINKAAEKGVVILLAPVYLGFECGSQGWCGEVRANSLAQMRSFGRYLGSRYRNFDNIIWLVGGDADPVATGVADKLREFVAGLKETDPVHLISAHNAPEQAGMDPWPNEAWLNLNNVYTYGDAYPKALQQRNRVPFKPFFLLETYYENEHSSTPLSLRRQAYWTILSGGLLGHIFGNCEIWGFSYGFCSGAWKPQLESTGSQTIARVGALFRSRPFFKLVPDQDHRVMTTGYQSGSTYAATSRADDGSTVIAYIPTRRAVSIDVSRVSGGMAKAWWFNPRTGSADPIGEYATTGTASFTPPTQEDWVLVLDDASAGFPAPGSSALVPAAPTNLRIIR